MFLKVLKYDTKKYLRFFLPIIAATVITGLFIGITAFTADMIIPDRTYPEPDYEYDYDYNIDELPYDDGGYIIEYEDPVEYYNPPFAMLEIAVTFIEILGLQIMFSGVIVLVVLSFIFYFRDIFTRRGYFTFSLPARQSTLLISKLLVIFVGVLSALLINALLLTVISLIQADSGIFEFFELLSDMSIDFMSVIIAILLIAFFILLIAFLSLFGASLAKTKKTAGAILCSIFGTYGIGIFMYFAFIFALLFGLPYYDNQVLNTIVDMSMITLLSAADVGLFFAAKYLITNKHELI